MTNYDNGEPYQRSALQTKKKPQYDPNRNHPYSATTMKPTNFNADKEDEFCEIYVKPTVHEDYHLVFRGDGRPAEVVQRFSPARRSPQPKARLVQTSQAKYRSPERDYQNNPNHVRTQPF